MILIISRIGLNDIKELEKALIYWIKILENYDETRFRVGVGGQQKIIVIKYLHVKIFHEDTNDHEHLSSGEFISGEDYTINLFVIMKG